jgi:hypothetical protein
MRAKSSYLFIISLLVCALCYSENDGDSDGDSSDYNEFEENNRPSKPIYKVIDEDGKVSFSNRPQKNAVEIELQGTNTLPEVVPRTKTNIQTETITTETDNSRSYKTLAITYPADGGAIANGLVPFTLDANLSPKLQKGHTLWLLIDGQRNNSSTQSEITVPPLERGQHTLQLIITDGSDNILKQSATSTINVLRPSIR